MFSHIARCCFVTLTIVSKSKDKGSDYSAEKGPLLKWSGYFF